MTTRFRFTTAQAAEYAGCHVQTVLKAAAAGELHGGQRKSRGRWTFRLDCIEAWLDGQACEHPEAGQTAPTETTPVLARRRVGSAS